MATNDRDRFVTYVHERGVKALRQIIERSDIMAPEVVMMKARAVDNAWARLMGAVHSYEHKLDEAVHGHD